MNELRKPMNLQIKEKIVELRNVCIQKLDCLPDLVVISQGLGIHLGDEDKEVHRILNLHNLDHWESIYGMKVERVFSDVPFIEVRNTKEHLALKYYWTVEK